jgi:hypothetical protein
MPSRRIPHCNLVWRNVLKPYAKVGLDVNAMLVIEEVAIERRTEQSRRAVVALGHAFQDELWLKNQALATGASSAKEMGARKNTGSMGSKSPVYQ